MVNVSRHGGTKNKYVREFNHLTIQPLNEVCINCLFKLSDNSFDLFDNLSTSHKVHHGLDIF